MACRTCAPCSPTDAYCITSPAVLAPCQCNDTPATREEGPPGAQGDVGETPVFTVGTVTEGMANVILVENNPVDYTVDFVIPSPPTGVANEWTAAQTFDEQAIFNNGLTTTGGTSTFGGTAFTVTPNAAFNGTVAIAGDETVEGTLNVEQNTNVTGDLTVGGNTTVGDLEIDGAVSFGTSALIGLTPVTGFIRGVVVLDSCGKPALVANRGSDLYQKSDVAGLTVIASGLTGQIAAAIPIVVPASTCLPQLTPVVNVMIRVAYNFASNPNGAIGMRLWKNAITTGTKLDDFVQGANTFDNTPAGCIILEGQTQLPVGTTNFYVEMLNDTDQDFTPTQVTSWVTN